MGGRSLQIFERMLRGAKIPLSDIYTTTTVLCSPKTRQPLRKEQKACFDRLSRQIEIIDPLVVLVMGFSSAKAVTSVKSRYVTFVKHDDEPYMEAVTAGAAGDVRRNAILTFSLKDIEADKGADELNAQAKRRDSDVFWVFKGLQRAKRIVDQYREIYVKK